MITSTTESRNGGAVGDGDCPRYGDQYKDGDSPRYGDQHKDGDYPYMKLR